MNEKDRTYLRQSFLRMLTEGTQSLPEAELNSWAASLALPMAGKDWFCAVIRRSEPDCSGSSLLRLQRQCEKLLAENGLEGFAVLGGGMDVLLLLGNYSLFDRAALKKLSRQILQRVNFPVQLGVGSAYRELSRIHYSREEAYEALAWGGGQVPVADIRDVYNGKQLSAATVQSSRKKVTELFRSGALDTLQQELEILAEQVRSCTVIQPDAPYPTSIRRTMIELLVEMMHIASDAGVDADGEIGHVDPYRKIFELPNTPAIIQWVVQTALILSQAMNRRQERMEDSVLDRVKLHIQEHLSDMELNLSSVSQWVGMSPGYLSAFFIREAGIGFKEYVTLQRIALAQKYLVETGDSINAISERCGFLSPSYFITVFKNHTGMTPGAYRKNEKLILRAE